MTSSLVSGIVFNLDALDQVLLNLKIEREIKEINKITGKITRITESTKKIEIIFQLTEKCTGDLLLKQQNNIASLQVEIEKMESQIHNLEFLKNTHENQPQYHQQIERISQIIEFKKVHLQMHREHSTHIQQSAYQSWITLMMPKSQ